MILSKGKQSIIGFWSKGANFVTNATCCVAQFFKLQSVFILPSKAKKARANGRNIVRQQLPTTPNIVGCFMLRSFAHPVACCYLLSGVVAQILKPGKLLATCKRTQQIPTMLDQHCWELFGLVRQQCCVRLHWALHL